MAVRLTRQEPSAVKRLILILAMLATALIAACSGSGGSWIETAGGGFIFNYRLAIAFAGVVVVPLKPLPEKSVIEVTMENPAGGDPIVMRRTPVSGGKIEFVTDPLTGIVADKEYAVTIRLIAENGGELQRIERTFRSQLDQSVLPPAALTVGPGYTPNPALPSAPLPPQ
jgi:hypothetical protein